MANELPAGTQITCENGHLICEVAVPLRVDTTPDAAEFTNWQIPPLARGDYVPECHCGALWYSQTFVSLQIHTPDGWWPD